MKRLSLQWRITIMTALLTCAACMLTNCLVGYTGMRYMDAIGSGISALSTADEDTPQAFDPTNVALDVGTRDCGSGGDGARDGENKSKGEVRISRMLFGRS